MDISAKNMVSLFGVKFSRLPDTKQYGDVIFCFVSFFLLKDMAIIDVIWVEFSLFMKPLSDYED